MLGHALHTSGPALIMYYYDKEQYDKDPQKSAHHKCHEHDDAQH